MNKAKWILLSKVFLFFFVWFCISCIIAIAYK